MKNYIYYSILFSILLLACNKDKDMNEGQSPTYPVEESDIIYRSLSIDNNPLLRSTHNNTFDKFQIADHFIDLKIDLDELEHNYITSGYKVKIKDAWIRDETEPEGGYHDDIEFENIDLEDHSIEFETYGSFKVEVKHPDFKEKDPSFGAYYEFPTQEFEDWPEGEPLIIETELAQHAVFLVYKIRLTKLAIESMEIEGNEVVEYQPLYIKAEKKFEIEIETVFDNDYEEKYNAGPKGSCYYYWVEDIIDFSN